MGCVYVYVYVHVYVYVYVYVCVHIFIYIGGTYNQQLRLLKQAWHWDIPELYGHLE